MTNVAEIRRGFAAADLLASAVRLAGGTIAEESATKCHENENLLLRVRESAFDCYLMRGEVCARRGLCASGADGWTWPIVMIESGWALGTIQGRGRTHYFPREILPQLARASEGVQFRRRHPLKYERDFELAAGWVSHAHIEGHSVHANVILFKREDALRAALFAAREDKRLDLFGISIMGDFRFQQRIIDGRPAPVATYVEKLDGVDLVCDGAAGGHFLGWS